MTGPGGDADKLGALREVLPATGAGIYLDTATRGPLPAETAAAMRDADEWELRVGRATEGRDEDLAQRLAEARAVLAALVVGDPSDIALTAGFEEALRAAVWSVDWRSGDRALAIAPGPETLAALHGVARLFDVAIDVASPDDVPAALRRGTRLVAMPHVDAATGRLLPVSEVAALARESGAWSTLDASLSAGAVPLDAAALGVDAIALAADRWLLGPEGSGALWVAPRLRMSGRLPLAGAAAHETLLPSVANPWPDARRYEASVLPRTAALGLARSVGWLEMYVGLDWAYERGRRLATALSDRLAAIASVAVLTPSDAMATIVSFKLAHWPTEDALAELRRRLFAIVSATPDGNAIRASVSWFNTDDEIDRFAGAVALLAVHTPETLPRRPPLIVR